MMSSREKVLVSVIAVLLVFSIGGLSWYFFTGKGKSKADSLSIASPSGGEIATSEKSVSSSTTSTSNTASTTPTAETDSSQVQLSLKEGDNLVTIPYYLSPNDGKTVFSGNSGIAPYFLNNDGQWISLAKNGSVTPGQGIWIVSDKTTTVPVSVVTKPVSIAKSFSITLNKGWNAIGNPYPEEITWDPLVKTSQGTTSFSKAVEAKIISVGYWADSVNKVYKTVSAGDKIKSYQGILVKSGGDKVELIISAS